MPNCRRAWCRPISPLKTKPSLNMAALIGWALSRPSSPTSNRCFPMRARLAPPPSRSRWPRAWSATKSAYGARSGKRSWLAGWKPRCRSSKSLRSTSTRSSLAATLMAWKLLPRPISANRSMGSIWRRWRSWPYCPRRLPLMIPFVAVNARWAGAIMCCARWRPMISSPKPNALRRPPGRLRPFPIARCRARATIISSRMCAAP